MFKKKIPTLVAIMLLVFSAVAGVILLDQESGFLPRAAPEYVPNQVKITNISDQGFTISWLTQEPTIGFIKYGLSPEDLNQTVVDERDQLTGSSNDFRSHYITVQDLNPQTTYYFKLGSFGNQLYDNQGSAFSITTASTLSPKSSSDTAYGTVYTPAQTPAEGAILYASLPGATPLSALVKQNGDWTLDLAAARSLDLQEYVSYDLNDTTLDLLVTADDGQKAAVVVKTGNDQPVPDIIIGQNADHTGTTPVYLDTGPESIDDAVSRFTIMEVVATDPDLESTITIDTIPADNTVINLTQPTLTGTAPANVEMIVTIHSSQLITDTILVDESGQWSWTPSENLSYGQHTITLSYSDDTGILHNLTRSFTVAAADSQDQELPSYQSTPSATLAPTKIPTLAPTTTVPTNIPTATPISQRSTYPSTSSASPTAGNTSATYAIVIIGLTLIFSGIVAFRKSD